MQIPLVMTIISPDRTGLVEAVARAVAEGGDIPFPNPMGLPAPGPA